MPTAVASSACPHASWKITPPKPLQSITGILAGRKIAIRVISQFGEESTKVITMM